jgi:hypothetical protein
MEAVSSIRIALTVCPLFCDLPPKAVIQLPAMYGCGTGLWGGGALWGGLRWWHGEGVDGRFRGHDDMGRMRFRARDGGLALA